MNERNKTNQIKLTEAIRNDLAAQVEKRGVAQTKELVEIQFEMTKESLEDYPKCKVSKSNHRTSNIAQEIESLVVAIKAELVAQVFFAREHDHGVVVFAKAEG